ncbi:ATP citrate lyase subunit 1 [Leucoagaricus gongylophorus]
MVGGVVYMVGGVVYIAVLRFAHKLANIMDTIITHGKPRPDGKIFIVGGSIANSTDVAGIISLAYC